jgi:hypothetical protein
MIDPEQIISDTRTVFFQSESQRKKYSQITKFVDNENYISLHRDFLTPLSVKINVELFHKEIVKFNSHFEQWGSEHIHLPRSGIALVNQDGVLKSQDPINGSLYEWNKKFPNQPIIESDCTTPTEVMQIESLRPLEIFKNHWFRSNILKWQAGAEFKPHIDTILPSPWLRLWGTTDAENLEIRYWDPDENQMRSVQNIESGRIYLIDTSRVHDAVGHGDSYQFFLSVSTDSIRKIQSLLLPH